MGSNNYQNNHIPTGTEDINKKTNKVKDFLKKKSVQAAIVLALAGAGTFAEYQIFKDKEPIKIEQLKDLKGYPFEKHHLAFWDDNKDFSTKNLPLERETLAPGVNIIRDAGLTFYIVQPEDIKTTKETTYTTKTTKTKHGKKTVKIPHTTIHKVGDFEKMRNKLMQTPDFSYLKDSEYDRSQPGNKTKSFNVPKENVIIGMYIPIPLDHKVREISPQDFANYCHDALKEMKSDSSVYSKDIKKLLTRTSEKEIIIDMLAFARSETASEYTNFVQPLGDVELHRREPAFKAFSFTYFHILMEKNSDGKTAGPGLEARIKLGLTEGQCYHPKNAAKLFLAYWIEKTHGHLDNIFPLTKNNIKNVGTKYNGSSTYVDKLQPNYVNSKFHHMYTYKTPKGITSNDKLKKTVVEQFNKNKAANCPTIDEDDVVNKGGKKISGHIIPDIICVCLSSK
ncbi:MAG: hypothetical protein NT085_03050 [candidate division SR1 bacterium]|nr:hypothetical protein [candidate division SR1 bacterium]